MSKKSHKLIYHFNWPVLSALLLLLGLGLLNLSSATFGLGEEGSLIFRSQIFWTFLGLGAFSLALWMPRHWIESGVLGFYGCTLLLLIAVLILGKSGGGQKNWLALGSLRIQPSELAKLSVILLLAHYYSQLPPGKAKSLKSVFWPLAIIGAPLILVLVERDLGSAIFFVLIGLSFVFLTGLKMRWMVLALVLLLGIGSVGYQFFLKDYQKARIQNFLHPEQDPRGTGYHLFQSKIAVGSGQVIGKGFRQGKLHQQKYLPERHTDFVFPVWAEEWGFIGSLFVLSIFTFFFLMFFHSAGKIQDNFSALAMMGIGLWLFWQWALNLSGVLGLAPLAGVTLPFFSYGGSSLVTNLFAVGLALNLHMRRYVF